MQTDLFERMKKNLPKMSTSQLAGIRAATAKKLRISQLQNSVRMLVFPNQLLYDLQ